MWIGWHWKKNAWHRMCEAPSMNDVIDELDRLVGFEPDNLRFGLTTGSVPGWTPRPKPGEPDAPE